MKPDDRIIQIVPAAGWEAVFFDPEDGQPFASPLCVFALIQDGEGTRVEGLWSHEWIDDVEDMSNWIGYKLAAEPLSEWADAAASAWRRAKEQGKRGRNDASS